MRGRIGAKTKNRYRRAIKDVIKGLSRRVVIYKQPIKLECDNCYYDKFTNKSTGKCKWSLSEAKLKQSDWQLVHPGQTHFKWFSVGRCPICRGKGYLEIKRKAYIDGLIIWAPESRYGNEMLYTPAGAEGSTTVEIKTDPKHYDVFKNCVSIIVDGIECKLSKPPLLRGLGNQAILIISAFSTDKPKLDSGEIIKEYSI